MYTKENKELIELLKPELYNHILDAKESFEMHSRQSIIHEILLEFFKILENGEDFFRNEKQCFDFKIKEIKEKTQIPFSYLLNNNLYVPKEIKDYIIKEATYVIDFHCPFEGRNSKINIVVFEKEITKEFLEKMKFYALKIYLWVYLLDKYAIKKCGNNLELFLYLTPFKKELPYSVQDIIGPYHVNTGVSDVCQHSGEIIVYRKEEWFKVFIHETMHNLGLDFSMIDNSNIKNKLRKVFTVQTDIKLFESYCEMWARLMNTIMEAYFFVKSERFKKIEKKETFFIEKFYEAIKNEIIFSFYQALKVLEFMGLDYQTITNINDINYSISKSLYKENSNVFAYYVITAILLLHVNDFLLWCYDNNENIINFKKTINNSNGESFVDFIEKISKKDKLLKLVIKLEDKISKDSIQKNKKMNLIKTMKMTLIGGD